MLLLQFLLNITVFFDISIAREVVGFICLTVLPGFVIIKLLKFEELDTLEIILFSIGFSVAILMLLGLFLNEFALLLAFSRPLSLTPLMIILNSLIFVCLFLVYKKKVVVETSPKERLRKLPLIVLFSCLPFLSVCGAIYVTVYGVNIILLSLIILISILFIFGVLSEKLFPSELYPFAIFAFTVALLYHFSFISNYIVSFGSDVPGEYFLFRTVSTNARWNPTLPAGLWYGRQNSMLSITILPTIYEVVMGIDPQWIFKMLYPLIFSLVPLSLYQIWRAYVKRKYAFISAFLFMAFEPFYTEMLCLNRQMIAEVFFVLLLLLIFKKEIKSVNRMICFTVFSFALITSHYALAVIFLFFMSVALALLFLFKRPSRSITVSMVVLFFVIMFTWYIFTSGSAAFNSIVEYGDYVYQRLNEFLNPASRGQEVLTGLGLAESPSIWNTISRTFSYLTQALIVLGFISLMVKRNRFNNKIEYLIFIVIAMVFLGLLIIIPGLAGTLKMSRFYHILLFFLSPLCALGAEFIIKLLFKREKKFAISVLLLTVLVPYFLFQTEFVFEVVGSDSWSIPLSGYRMDALRLYGHYGYTDAYSVYGAQWLFRNVNLKNSELYADESSLINVLPLYGMIYGNTLSNVTEVADNGVIYLSTLNVVEKVIPYGRFSLDTDELSFIFDDMNIVYSNGGSEIYKHSP